MRIWLCCAVALMLVGCGSSKNSSAVTGSSTAPSGSTTGAAGATPSSTGPATTTTARGGASDEPKPTGAFCADVRNGAVSSALLDAANPNAANASLDELKKIDGEAPSEIKTSVDAMLHLLTQIHDAGTDAAKQSALTAGSVQLQTAATTIGNYITAHCR